MFQQEITGNKYLLFIITGLFVALLVSGCGHRGDLYLPDTNTNETTKQKKKAS